MLRVRIWNLFLLAHREFSMGSFDLVLCCALVLVTETELPSDCSDIVTVSRDLFGCPPERSRGAASFVVDPYFVSCFYRFSSARSRSSSRSSSFSMFRAERCQARSCTVHPVGKLVASGLVGGVNFM